MTAAGMGASPDAGSASLSSSGSVSTSSSAAGKMDASVGDTCAYFAPIEGESCSRRRRSCYDCLNVEIASEKYGCALTTSGMCASMELYAQSMADNTTSVYLASNSSSSNPTSTTTRPFSIASSANTTYCEASDDACTKCYAEAKSATSSSTASSLSSVVCVGAGGCLCFASCEPSIWKRRTAASNNCGHVNITVTTPMPVAATTTATPSPSVAAAAATTTTYSSSYDTAQLFITAAQAFGVFTLIYVGIRGRSSASAEPEAIHAQRAPRSPRDHLRLSQWRSLQQELIESEKEKPRGNPSLAGAALTSADHASPA